MLGMKNKVKVAISYLGLFICCVGLLDNCNWSLIRGSNNANSLPNGWRYPEDKDIYGEWKNNVGTELYVLGVIREKPYFVAGDFNGDNILDQGWILLSDDGARWGLFVYLGRKNSKPAILKIFEVSVLIPAQYSVISLASSGPNTIKTACGRGLYECKPGEPEEIRIEYDSIYFCKPESACQLIIWNEKRKNFDRVQIDD